MQKIQIFLLILIIIGIGLLITQKVWVPKLVEKILLAEEVERAEQVENTTIIDSSLKDGQYCFSRHQLATAEAPYEVKEDVVLNIDGNSVVGTKNGTQNGPDMTNGYEGVLKGSRNGNSFEFTYSYVIEGSSNRELEFYELENNALIKLRWPLVEENGILVPDKTTDDPARIIYLKSNCNE